MEFTSQPGFRAELTLIGTLGDRIVLDHCRWFGKPGGDAFEFERVRLLEVGADGLLRAVLFFDPEDRLAASIEGLARFAAGEASWTTAHWASARSIASSGSPPCRRSTSSATAP